MHDSETKRARILESLENRILYGLACEWEHILGVLDPRMRLVLRKPMFSLKDLGRRLGYWSSDNHEICLNRQFVRNHSWRDVLDVLRHEMAHQLSGNLPGPPDNRPHGEKFKEACHLLRANPRATARFTAVDQKSDDYNSSTEDKILRRVKKLLALAESQNHHEAEAAMVKAHQLIDRYNIDLLERNMDREFTSRFLGSAALRHKREAYHLASLILDYYFVQGIWISTFVLDKGKMGRVLEITGTPQNVEMAAYVFDFITNYIDGRWRQYNRKKGLTRYRKTDFSVGVIEGFRSKLEAGRAQYKNANDLALIRIDDPQLSSHMKYKYPRVKTFTRQASSQDDSVLNDGIQVGKKLVISKGITEKARASDRRIEY